MTLDQSLEYEPRPLYDSETLYRQQSIRGTGRSETAAWPKKNGKRIAIELDENDKSLFGQFLDRSLVHILKNPFSSSSAS